MCFPVESQSSPEGLHTDPESKEVIPWHPPSLALGFPISKAAARMFWYPSHSTQAATKLWLACTPPQTPPQASILRGEKRRAPGTSLVVQWLTIHLKMQGMQVRPLIGELISHVPQGN